MTDKPNTQSLTSPRRGKLGPTEAEVSRGTLLYLLWTSRKNLSIPTDKRADVERKAYASIHPESMAGAIAFSQLLYMEHRFIAEQWLERANGPTGIAYYHVQPDPVRERLVPTDLKEMLTVRKRRRMFYSGLAGDPYFFEFAKAIVSMPGDAWGPEKRGTYILAVATWLEWAMLMWFGADGNAQKLMDELRAFDAEFQSNIGLLSSMTEEASHSSKELIFSQYVRSRPPGWFKSYMLWQAFNPRFGGTRGAAKARGAGGHKSAARGWLVKKLSHLVPKIEGPRYAIISGLLGYCGIEGVTPQYVRALLKKGRT